MNLKQSDLVDRGKIESEIDGVLKKAKFRKKGASWYWDTSECTCVVNLQKSQWGNQYYVNLGVLLKGLTPIANPKESQCHIRERLSEIVPNKREFEKAFNLEEPLGTKERLSIVSESIEKQAFPFLSLLQSADGIRGAFKAGKLRSFTLTLDAKRFLQLPLD